MTEVIGLDVGGTKVAGRLVVLDGSGFVDVDGFLLESGATSRDRALLDGCVAAVGTLVERNGLDPANVPVGIGICELVDRQRRITTAVNVDWLGIEVTSAFGHHHVMVDADVRVAALAEATFGAGAASSDFVYLSVGTGISFVHVVDGLPRPGHRGNALMLGAPPVEHISAGPAIAAAAGTSDAQGAFRDARHDAVIDRAAQHLGTALAWLVNALDPELIVVGGGLGLNDRYRELAAAAMRPAIEACAARSIRVVPALLGERAGSIGAALVAAGHREKR